MDISRLSAYLPARKPPQVQPWEIFRQLSQLKPGKSSGPDAIPAKLIKLFAYEFSSPLCDILNCSFSEQVVPTQWKKAIVVPVPKEKPASVEKLRPIALTDHFAKVAEWFITKWLLSDIQSSLDPKQFGSRVGMSTTHCLVDLVNSLSVNADKIGNVTTVVTTDFSKAFDKVDHTVVISKLIKYSPDSNLVRWIINFLTDRSQCVRYRGHLSDWTSVKAGVPQGTRLGPVLFLILIDDALSSSDLQHWKYVDDMTVAESVARGAVSKIQGTMASLDQWCNVNNMSLNASKCNTMRIYFGKTPIPYQDLQLANHSLNQVDCVKILGVLVQSNLKWDNHVNELLMKANRRMQMLRSLIPFHLPQQDLLTIYTGFIRPLLEYAAPAWHPGLTIDHSNKIERLQKRALRLILGPLYQSYEEALRHTNLESLKDRRNRLCLKFAESLAKDDRFRLWLPPLRQDMRSRTLRRANPYQPIRCRTDRYKKSPIPFFVSLLNSR